MYRVWFFLTVFLATLLVAPKVRAQTWTPVPSEPGVWVQKGPPLQDGNPSVWDQRRDPVRTELIEVDCAHGRIRILQLTNGMTLDIEWEYTPPDGFYDRVVRAAAVCKQ